MLRHAFRCNRTRPLYWQFHRGFATGSSDSKNPIDNIQSKKMRKALDQRRFALKLYKGILRSHDRLPSEMRGLGNEYVRSEFKLHKDAAPEHLRGFFSNWLGYLTHMSQVQDVQSPGKNLNDKELDALSEEQAAQLSDLATEINKLYGQPPEEDK